MEIVKLPCVLVLACSDTMLQLFGSKSFGSNLRRIDALNVAVKDFIAQLKDSPTTRKMVDIAIVQVSGMYARVAQDWTVAKDFEYQPLLSTQPLSPLADGFILAANLCKQRKEYYLNNGIDYYSPQIILITDRLPTDDEDWENAVHLVKEIKKRKQCKVLGVIVDGCSAEKETTERLSQLCTYPDEVMLLSSARYDLSSFLSSYIECIEADLELSSYDNDNVEIVFEEDKQFDIKKF